LLLVVTFASPVPFCWISGKRFAYGLPGPAPLNQHEYEFAVRELLVAA
jgi:hypothetical protein